MLVPLRAYINIFKRGKRLVYGKNFYTIVSEPMIENESEIGIYCG